MATNLDKGKMFTNVISKEGTKVVLQTRTNKVSGNIYTPKGDLPLRYPQPGGSFHRPDRRHHIRRKGRQSRGRETIYGRQPQRDHLAR